MRVVIRIGGSVIGSPPNPNLIQKYAKILQDLRTQGHELAVIVGGGAPARQFIKLAKDAGLPEPEQDEIAISVSRLFAHLLAMKIGGQKRKRIPTSIKAAVRILQNEGFVVMGGLKPGMTTDTVAALFASESGAEFIVKATDQEGIFTKDPRKNPDARKIEELSFDELSQLLEQDKHKAGIHQIIDPEAVRMLITKRIKTIVINGLNPENLSAVMKGEKKGTLIR